MEGTEGIGHLAGGGGEQWAARGSWLSVWGADVLGAGV